jgi:hypothetical protein
MDSGMDQGFILVFPPASYPVFMEVNPKQREDSRSDNKITIKSRLNKNYICHAEFSFKHQTQKILLTKYLQSHRTGKAERSETSSL